jgi:U3 small nucleolar RNA-associated protein 25
LSKYLTPEIQAFFKRELCNVKGREKMIDEPVPILLDLEDHLTFGVPINHVFQCVSRTALASASEDRFLFFIQQVLPKLQSSSGVSQVCIFISSYFEFVQLREYFTKNELSFTSLHDYATGPEISGARSVFFNKHVKYVLVTERFHYFRRYRIRGIENLFFYSLPAEPHFYLEYIHFLASYKLNLDNKVLPATILGSPPLQIISLFDSFDYFKLSRLIGSSSASEMIRNNSIDSYLFSS